MSWAVGWDSNWYRDIGYGVPAYCDQPDCGKEIDRGLGYVCGEDPYGGEMGCGLYFCDAHLSFLGQAEPARCDRCCDGEDPYDATPDHPRWIAHKLTDPSWASWRAEHRFLVAAMREGRVTQS